MREDSPVKLKSPATKSKVEKRKAEHTARVDQDLFQAIIHKYPDAVFLLDIGDSKIPGKIVYVNEAACTMHGYTSDEMIGHSLNTFVDPEIAKRSSAIQKQILKKKSLVLESEHLRKDGTSFPLEVTLKLLECNKSQTVLAINRNISRQKEAEEAARESRHQFETLVHSIEGIVWEADPETFRFTFVSQQAERLLGYPTEEWQSPTFLIDHIHPDDLTEAMAFCQASTAALQSHQLDYRMIAQDGRLVWIRNIITVETQDDQPVYLRGIMVDITLIRESEGKYRNLVERLNDVIFTLDSQGIITYISPVIEQYSGYFPEEVIGQTLNTLVVQDDISTLTDRIRKLVSTQSEPIEFQMKTKSGDWVWTRCSCRLIMDGEEVIEARGILTDISDRRRIEEERIKFSKLESLGLLAGGIAHDFNNLLTGIIGHISIANLSIQKDDTVGEQIQAAEQAAMRAKDLTYQLLTFAKGGAPVMESTSLHDLLVDSTTFAYHGSNIKCEFDIDARLLEANVDSGQISQVIQNLAINADQAMPDGGTFRVAAENVTLGAACMPPHVNLPAGTYVKIAFTDEGCGIAPEHVTKVFDPYFTTKNAGSGLGLATTHSIIIQHSGTIAVESTLGKGTTFTVYLPAIPGKKVSEPPERPPAPISQKKIPGGRVLVLDDEEMICTLVEQILTRYGYEVVATSDGVDTLSSYRQAQSNGSPFDVVVLDLTIPGGMGGKEVMQQLLTLDPDVNAIVSSGYYNDPIMANYQEYGFSGIVAKPYKVQDLLETVQETIQRPD